jgi:hypothetical protein
MANQILSVIYEHVVICLVGAAMVKPLTESRHVDHDKGGLCGLFLLDLF